MALHDTTVVEGKDRKKPTTPQPRCLGRGQPALYPDEKKLDTQSALAYRLNATTPLS